MTNCILNSNYIGFKRLNDVGGADFVCLFDVSHCASSLKEILSVKQFVIIIHTLLDHRNVPTSHRRLAPRSPIIMITLKLTAHPVTLPPLSSFYYTSKNPLHSLSKIESSISLGGGSKLLTLRCVSDKFSVGHDSDESLDHAYKSIEMIKQEESTFLDILKGANRILPHVVIASTILALIYPPSFTWFTSRYYAPALGFLMFAVGVNSSEKDFLEAFNRPSAIAAGYAGQFVLKPILGYLFGTLSMTMFDLPTSLGAGILLTSCVSGAQLSNYATFLTDPQMAPLSIVMTSLSTATAAFVTPILSLLLIGKRLPVDVKGMVANILQIVVAPVMAGLLLNRFFPRVSGAIRPLLPPLSVCVTALCVGAPLAINIDSVLSPFGMSIVLLVTAFHLTAFISGYVLSGIAFSKVPDVKALQRTISYETGMQSSLLALALANRFFEDPLVSVPPAISVVIMSLMGFSLVMLWARKKE